MLKVEAAGQMHACLAKKLINSLILKGILSKNTVRLNHPQIEDSQQEILDFEIFWGRIKFLPIKGKQFFTCSNDNFRNEIL